jgi:hypothetical protein
LSPVPLVLDDSLGFAVGLAESGVTPPTPMVAVTGLSVLPGALENVERARGELVRRAAGDAVAVRLGVAAGVCVGDGLAEATGGGERWHAGFVSGQGLAVGLAAGGDGLAVGLGDSASAVPGRERARKGSARTPPVAKKTRNRGRDVGTAPS